VVDCSGPRAVVVGSLGVFLFGLGCWHGVDVFLRAFVVGDVSDF